MGRGRGRGGGVVNTTSLQNTGKGPRSNFDGDNFDALAFARDNAASQKAKAAASEGSAKVHFVCSLSR